MIAGGRGDKILEVLASAGEELSVAEIARRLGRVSAVTVRRSVARLAAEGRLERTHGGAVFSSAEADARHEGVKEAGASFQDEIDGADAIILPPIGGRGADTLRAAAKRRGIPILAESSPQEGGVYLGPDNFLAGRELGRAAGAIAARLKRPLVLVVSHDELPNTRARSDGFLKGLSEALKTSVKSLRVDGKGSFKDSLRASLDAFGAEPNINIVFGVNDHSVLAAIEASERQGKGVIDAFGVGGEGDTIFEALAARSQLRACAALFPEIVGIRAVETLAVALHGGHMPKEVRTPHAIVTADNLDSYYVRDASGWVLARAAVTTILQATDRPANVHSLSASRTIGFVPHFPAHDWYRNMGRAIRKRAAELGLNVKIAAPQAGIAREILSLRRMIARAAAKLVPPHSTILINAGPISLLLADELAEQSDVTIVTNSIEVLERLTGRPGIKIIMTSGEFQAKDRCLVGPSLGALFETMRIDRAFLSVDGISANFGPSASDERLALAARRFVDASRETFILADHSLVGIEANHRIVPTRAVQHLITDSGSLPSDRLALASAGVRIALGDEEPEASNAPAIARRAIQARS
jgi:DeoR/GlpR family transcriptional regulator of sugar metabolism/DNA-binding LacI/PurR family transcriptional regulator